MSFVSEQTMPYSNMDIAALSRFLGMDIRKAKKAALRGDIPCQKVGGQMRFNRAEVNHWLQKQLGTMEKSSLKELDRGLSAEREIGQSDLLLSPILNPDAISVSLQARTKKSVLKKLTELADATGLLWDSQGLYESLIEREEIASTAMPGGVAIPHPHKHSEYMQAEAIIAIGHTTGPIAFGCPDGGMTDLFFMICAPDDRQHIHILARMCQILQDKDFIDELREAPDSYQIIETIKQFELQIISAK